MAIIPFKMSDLLPESPVERPFSTLHREMNRLFEGLLPEAGLRPVTWRSTAEAIQPSIDVTESEKAFLVTAELPGVEEKDVEVSLSDDVLTLKGEKRLSKEEKEKDYMRMERSYGAFYRSIPFPTRIDENAVKAEYKNGVLTVVCPKAPEAIKATKKIPIHK